MTDLFLLVMGDIVFHKVPFSQMAIFSCSFLGIQGFYFSTCSFQILQMCYILFRSWYIVHCTDLLRFLSPVLGLLSCWKMQQPLYLLIMIIFLLTSFAPVFQLEYGCTVWCSSTLLHLYEGFLLVQAVPRHLQNCAALDTTQAKSEKPVVFTGSFITWITGDLGSIGLRLFF